MPARSAAAIAGVPFPAMRRSGRTDALARAVVVSGGSDRLGRLLRATGVGHVCIAARRLPTRETTAARLVERTIELPLPAVRTPLLPPLVQLLEHRTTILRPVLPGNGVDGPQR